jgi:hypothetical protein
MEGTRAQTRGGGRLSRRRYSCSEGRRGFGNESGEARQGYRSDFKRTWVRLGERGRRDRPGARRGESLFSLVCIEIQNLIHRKLIIPEQFTYLKGSKLSLDENR